MAAVPQDLSKGDLYLKRLEHPVHWVNLETGEVPCPNQRPGEKDTPNVNNVTCLGCRRVLMNHPAVFGRRYVWGRW